MNRLLHQFNAAVFFAIRCRSLSSPLFLLLLWGLLHIAPASVAYGWDTSQDTWALLGGYGQSLPGWGRTTERVQTIDFVPRYNHMTIDRLGSGWYQGFHSTLIELPVHVVTSPDVSTMVGFNFLACYTFTSNDRWKPYIFGGGGPVYSFANIPGMGARWNGNYQFAIGLEHPYNPSQSLLLEVRYHHISNAGTEDPNDPLNSIKLLVGVTF
jgi:lipid A 3-O-deacylase